jgi:hypothetical protein
VRWRRTRREDEVAARIKLHAANKKRQALPAIASRVWRFFTRRSLRTPCVTRLLQLLSLLAVRNLMRARLRRRCVHTAVCVLVCSSALSGNGLHALALLRSRSANARTIERCRAVAAGESRCCERGGSGNQQGGDKLVLHDDSNKCFGFRFRKTSRHGAAKAVCNIDGNKCIPLLSRIYTDNPK